MIQWLFFGFGTALFLTFITEVWVGGPPPTPPADPQPMAWSRTASITLTAPERKTGNECWDMPSCVIGTQTRPDLVLCIDSAYGNPVCPSGGDLWERKCTDTFECTVRATLPDTPSFRVRLLDRDTTDASSDIIGEGECRDEHQCNLAPGKSGWNTGSVFIKFD